MRRSSRVSRQLTTMKKSISSLNRTLRQITGFIRRLERAPKAAGVARRRLKLTPQRRAALKLQGQYMGYMRQLRPTQRSQVKSLRVKSGILVAIARAKRLAKS